MCCVWMCVSVAVPLEALVVHPYATHVREVLSSHPSRWGGGWADQWRNIRGQEAIKSKAIWRGGIWVGHQERMGRAGTHQGRIWESSPCWLSPLRWKPWLVSTEHASSVPGPSIILSLTRSPPSVASSVIHLSEVLKAALSQVRTLS